MKQTLFILLFTFSSIEISSQEKEISKEIYSFKKGDFNGIGKWFLGREIAYIMGYEGINWLERSSREKEENTSKLIKNMKIKPTDIIADIGAGSGYHTFKIAPLVNKGKVFAVDIQPEMLLAIEANKKYIELKNIELVLGDEQTTNLPENTFDKILMVDVYHEFNYPKEMLQSIKKALKKEGQLFLIEYRLEDETIPIKKIHKMSEKQAVKELASVGLVLKKNINNLPIQHCMIFIKN
jgi:ubiquinone/menaquinone biosynthesis C-methylase UbiE